MLCSTITAYPSPIPNVLELSEKKQQLPPTVELILLLSKLADKKPDSIQTSQ